MMIELLDGKLGMLKGKVRAILLYGSLARGEADELSDIDIMVIVNSPAEVESIKREIGDSNVIVTTEEGFRRYLQEHPSAAIMLKEAVILHGEMPEIPELRKEWMVRELNEALKMLDVAESLLHDVDAGTTDAVIYSAILRARQAYIIRCLIRNERMTKKGFLEELEKMGIKPEYYDYYRLARDDRLNVTLPERELKRLVRAVRRYVRKVREEVKRL
ncbi:nucleotidyltransferase domain-containing protein [Archaeoglobus sp.]